MSIEDRTVLLSADQPSTLNPSLNQPAHLSPNAPSSPHQSFPYQPSTLLPATLTAKQASNCHVIADRLTHYFALCGYWPVKRNRIRRGVRLELAYRCEESDRSTDSTVQQSDRSDRLPTHANGGLARDGVVGDGALGGVASPVRVFYVVCEPHPCDTYEMPTESTYTIRESGLTAAEVAFAAYSQSAYKLIERMVRGLFCSPAVACSPVPSSDDRLLSGCSIRRPVKSLHRLIPQYNGQYNGSLSNGESGLTIDNSSIDKPSL